jgi:hypothetical protein
MRPWRQRVTMRLTEKETTMFKERPAVVLAVLAAVAGGCLFAADAKPKTDLVLDTPENALKSYTMAWQNVDFAGIMACVKTTDAAKKDIVERYVTYMMWCDSLERACIAKFGEDDGLKVLGHARALAKQYELDIKKRIVASNIEYEPNDRTRARIFLKVEKDRPEGLQTDKLTYRDDYRMAKEAGNWKVDFLKTYELDDPDPDRVEEVKYYAYKAYPVLNKRLKELIDDVKAGKIKLADDVKTEIENAWQKVPGTSDPP